MALTVNLVLIGRKSFNLEKQLPSHNNSSFLEFLQISLFVKKKKNYLTVFYCITFYQQGLKNNGKLVRHIKSAIPNFPNYISQQATFDSFQPRLQEPPGVIS